MRIALCALLFVLPLVVDAAAPDTAAEKYFTNIELMDQDGRRHRFYADLLKDKAVVINFAFVGCKGSCSPVTKNLAQVQRLLGSKVGQDVRMLTISVDPVVDTSKRLKEFAAKFGAGPGWYFLTGDKASVDAILKKLGGYTAKPEEHPNTVYIGDLSKGYWTKTFGMDRPENIAEAVKGIGK